jgi:hypothetical protein
MANPDTITIGSDTFNVYGPRADADTYFNGKINRDSWSGAAATTKDRALVTATRLLDLEPWEGAPTDLVTPQPVAWPRTGVTDKNGQSVGTSIFPTDLLYGYYELAQALVDNPSLDESADQDSNIKEVMADVVAVKFFRPTSGTRFPTTVHNFIAQFLSLDATASFSSGTDQESTFESELYPLGEAWL